MAEVKEYAAIARENSAPARSNSYNLVPVRSWSRRPGAPCPLRGTRDVEAVDAVDVRRGRALVVRLRDRMTLVRTATQDFTDDELDATTHALGQVYADVSAKLAPDDFARDLRKLRPSRDCATCPDPAERGGDDACPGCWEAVPGDPFTRDDARVMGILGTLSGRVLDVGGGEGTYLSALAPRAAEIDYLCVDPDAGRLALLAARHPWARFSVGVAEELSTDLGAFDHVLFLRSYNHLADPARALSRALDLLGPRGSLTLVDNVAFGLVRTAAQAARAEAAPANKLEHYRNDDAGQADLAVQEAAREAGRTLRLVERRDVGPETSNQWLLRYE